MMSSRDSRYRAGGPMDDVAQNIRNEQRHDGIDRNPSMPCTECGEEYPWEHFKNHGKVPDNPENPILCAACNGGLRSKSVEERKGENHDLEGFRR